MLYRLIIVSDPGLEKTRFLKRFLGFGFLKFFEFLGFLRFFIFLSNEHESHKQMVNLNTVSY